MTKNIFSTLILLLALTACSTQSPQKPTITAENNSSKKNNTIIIDLDKELESNADLRGKDTLLIDTPIYIGDNDEVSFKGDYLKEESPIQIKIGDNDEVSFTGDHYNIKTMQLQSGDLIQMKGKSGRTFVEMEVIR